MVTGTISEILAHKGAQLFTIPADATVFEAIQLMAEKNVGALHPRIVETKTAGDARPSNRPEENGRRLAISEP